MTKIENETQVPTIQTFSSGTIEAKGSDWVLTKWHGDRYRIEFPSQNRYIYFLDRDREAIQSILNTLDLDEKITILDR